MPRGTIDPAPRRAPYILTLSHQHKCVSQLLHSACTLPVLHSSVALHCTETHPINLYVLPSFLIPLPNIFLLYKLHIMSHCDHFKLCISVTLTILIMFYNHHGHPSPTFPQPLVNAILLVSLPYFLCNLLMI